MAFFFFFKKSTFGPRLRKAVNLQCLSSLAQIQLSGSECLIVGSGLTLANSLEHCRLCFTVTLRRQQSGAASDWWSWAISTFARTFHLVSWPNSCRYGGLDTEGGLTPHFKPSLAAPVPAPANEGAKAEQAAMGKDKMLLQLALKGFAEGIYSTMYNILAKGGWKH